MAIKKKGDKRFTLEVNGEVIGKFDSIHPLKEGDDGKGKRFVTCPNCVERFETASKDIMVSCVCGQKFNSLRTTKYIQPGAYLYAFVTVDEHGELQGLSRCTKELSPEEMKRIALQSTEEEDSDG